MKIGLFSDTYYPKANGVATSVLMLKENLEASGHKVYVFTSNNPEVSEPEDNVVRIPSIPLMTQRLGVIISPALRRYIKSLSLDVIHTHTEFTLGRLGRRVAKKMDIPVVHTMHTIYEYYTGYLIKTERFDPIFRKMIRKLTAKYCNDADTVIVPSGKTEGLMRDYGVHRDIRVIPSGIELDRFITPQYDADKTDGVRAELGISEHNKVLINVGRVSQEKKLDVLITSLRDYLSHNPHVLFLIVGDGPARKELEQLAADLNIGKQVIFAGTRPWDEIHMYYKLGDVFIGASESETQGITYIEAMASGCPVIAKEDRCLDNLLTEGGNGYSFNDAEGLVSAVGKLLGDDDLLRQFAEEASKSALRFSADSFARNVNAVYDELVATRASA